MKYYAYKVDSVIKNRPWFKLDRPVVKYYTGTTKNDLVFNYSKDIIKAIDERFACCLEAIVSCGEIISDYNCIISYKTRKGKYFEFDVICAPIILNEIFDLENL